MILVYGATGLTGGLIARRLVEAGATVAIGGRDAHRLRACAEELGADVEQRVAHVHDRDSLAAAMDGVDVVVNCAGPFLRLGEPVVRAAIDAGCHYIDTTGEQAFMRDIYERYESAARKAEVVVINGMAFEISLGDWAASLAAEALEGEGRIDEVLVGYAVNHLRASRGTQLSAIEQMAAPGCVWHDDRWVPVAPAAETRTLRFTAPFGVRETLSFPSGEIISIPRHIDAREVKTYISLLGGAPWEATAAKALTLMSPMLPLLMSTPLAGLARAGLEATTPAAPAGSQRGHTHFAILAEATRDFRRARTCVSGFDVYEVSGVVASRAAIALATRDDVEPGVLTPSQVFDPRTELEALVELCDVTVQQS